MEYVLIHHGIKGMKWGVRRYQNKDGSLTPAGKKRVSKEYKKAAYAVGSKLTKNGTQMYMDAYNKAVNYMNNGRIEQYNAEQRKKYGENFAKRDGYVEDYERIFEEALVKNLNKSLNEFYANDSSVKKARNIIKKYNMTQWDDLAKENEAKIEEIRRIVESYND